MNKRIQKKVQKNFNYRIKTGKLRLESGDTVIVKVDTMKENYDLIRIMFETISEFAKDHGCDCLLTAKEVDINLLTSDQIQRFRDIIAKWEVTANE